jgi:imidazolonepropionase-like amidohydrolase
VKTMMLALLLAASAANASSAATAASAAGASSAASAPTAATGDVLALHAGRVLPATTSAIEDGVVLVRDGKIEAVGAAKDVVVPEGATRIDLPEAWLVPGFVDLHDHVAGTDINDMVHPINTDLRVIDQVSPGSLDMLDAVAGGVTTVLFLPGSGTNIGGFAALLKTYGRTQDEMLVRFPGAMKIAQAGNPERRSGEIGRGRMGMNWNLREALIEGRDYDDRWTAFEQGRTKEKPAIVPRLELMRGLFRHEFPVLVHTQWMPVYQSSIRMLRDEFGLWVVLSHAEFDSFAADPLVIARDMPVNVGPRGYHVDYDTGEISGLAVLHHEAGVRRLSVNTDSPVVPEEELPFQAGVAVRYGLDWQTAFRALTIEPATAIGLADRVGSIEPGKDADLVFWTGDPLDPRSHVLLVVGDGRVALDQREGPRRW